MPTPIIVLLLPVIVSAARRSHEHEGLTVEHLNKTAEQRADSVRRVLLGRRDSRKLARQRDKAEKDRNEDGC